MRTQTLLRMIVTFFLWALAVLNPFAAASAQSSGLAEKLRSGDHILLIRHALAPGVGDPANYTLVDCRTQRNLSQEGRQQATRLGEWLRKQGVAAADVYSSPWCRCKDTAELMQFGGFKVEPTLASFFDDMSKAKASNQALQLFVTKTLKDKGNKALILVTHHVNIYEYVGENIDSGDMVLVKVDRQGKMMSYQRIARPS
jgi:phosphohistidine phosphatase SixA